MDAKTSCNVLGCFKDSSVLCSSCKKCGYCSKEHQKEHWKDHKSCCVRISKKRDKVLKLTMSSPEYEKYQKSGESKKFLGKYLDSEEGPKDAISKLFNLYKTSLDENDLGKERDTLLAILKDKKDNPDRKLSKSIYHLNCIVDRKREITEKYEKIKDEMGKENEKEDLPVMKKKNKKKKKKKKETEKKPKTKEELEEEKQARERLMKELLEEEKKEKEKKGKEKNKNKNKKGNVKGKKGKKKKRKKKYLHNIKKRNTKERVKENGLIVEEKVKKKEVVNIVVKEILKNVELKKKEAPNSVANNVEVEKEETMKKEFLELKKEEIKKDLKKEEVKKDLKKEEVKKDLKKEEQVEEDIEKEKEKDVEDNVVSKDVLKRSLMEQKKTNLMNFIKGMESRIVKMIENTNKRIDVIEERIGKIEKK